MHAMLTSGGGHQVTEVRRYFHGHGQDVELGGEFPKDAVVFRAVARAAKKLIYDSTFYKLNTQF